MSNFPEPGIYESRSSFGSSKWCEDRRVYIQGSTVRLVSYKPNCMSEEEYSRHQKLGYDLFNYDWFFQVNILGPRVGDLPENFDIRKHSTVS